MKETVQAAPKTLVRRGLEDGTQRLRGQLRDAAQDGRADDYGGDRIEDAAASGTQWAARGIESFLKKKKTSRYSDAKGRSPSTDTSEPDTPEAGPEAGSPAPNGDIGADPPAPGDTDRPRIKTREAVEAPAARNGGQQTAPRQQRAAASAKPKGRIDRPQIKTREAVSHTSPEAGRPATAPAAQAQRIRDIPGIPKGRVDPPPIKTRDIARAEDGGAPIPAGRRGAGRPTGRRDISGHPIGRWGISPADRQGASGHRADDWNASGCSAPVNPNTRSTGCSNPWIWAIALKMMGITF